MKRKRKAYLSSHEVSVLVALAATLDEARFKHNGTKALILKCKDIMDNPPNSLVVTG